MNSRDHDTPPDVESLRAFHRRPGLSKRIRYLASIEALVALGEDHILPAVFELALEEGVKLKEIHEIMLQACIFCGYPRTINGFALLRRSLRNRGMNRAENSRLPLDQRSREDLDEMGADLFRRIYPFNHEEVLDDLREDHPELPGWILRDVYGKTLARPALDPKTRELAAIAALTVMQVFPQLLSHIKGGLNLGADQGEVREVILQMESFAPQDAVRRALRFLSLGTRPSGIAPSPKRSPHSSVPEAS